MLVSPKTKAQGMSGGYLKQIIEGRVVVSKASDGLSGFDFNGKYVSAIFD